MFLDPYAVALAAIALDIDAGDIHAMRLRTDWRIARPFRDDFGAAYDALNLDPATY